MCSDSTYLELSLSTIDRNPYGGLEKFEIIQISNYEELVGTGVQIDSYMKTIMDSSICHRQTAFLDIVSTISSHTDPTRSWVVA